MATTGTDSVHSHNPALPRHVSAQVTAITDGDGLRRCINDILAITALPTIWLGLGLDDICQRLLDVVGSLLNVDLMVLKIALRQGESLAGGAVFGFSIGAQSTQDGPSAAKADRQ